ncbi:CPBP family intramembrane glutamic endopeptidase [Halopiger goleimassiliensis]|uniref:CPBP family intramembrane glutamic endopeptidase n=1 Tax=Halopiger goleimassiliensis TaxID=1293048 RepID=UPI000A85CEAC|nr:type II CAAX endopeptidase family protein [Halopiger goleimassiliensis]
MALIAVAYVAGNLVVYGVFVGAGDALGPGGALLVQLLGLQATFALIGVAFLRGVVGRDFVPITRPTRSDVAIAAAAIGATLVLAALHALGIRLTTLEAAGTVPIPAEIDPGAVLVVFAAAILVPSVVEELLFRGIVQRYVSEVSSIGVGIAVATVLFVPVHGAGIIATAPTAVAGLAVAGLLATVSIVIGFSYARTDNFVVPILVHAGYNGLSGIVTELIYALPL